MSVKASEQLVREPAHKKMPYVLCLAACFALLLLTGCFTNKALTAVNQPTGHSLYDRIDSVHKVVLKEHTLLIFLEGRLSNSPATTEFTLTIPLTDIETGELPPYGRLKVSRDAISTGWASQIGPDDNRIAIPIGPALHQNGHPDDYPWERPVVYIDSTSLPPGATRTIYPLFLYDNGNHLAMEFVYLDAGKWPKRTLIYVDQVRVTKTKHEAYYCLLPLTIPLDIAFSPIYLGMFIIWVAGGDHC
jgi:hypothetical protein